MSFLQGFAETILSNTLLMVFLIIAIGFLIGKISFFGLELGDAGVLLAALVFGHFGIVVPSIIKDLGLICFVTAVGFIAGPKFFKNFKDNQISYLLVGFSIILSGALLCIVFIEVFHVPVDLCLGMLSGALTSTPGLAAALEATGSQTASVGYGIAYPFGVIGVVLFVQLMPKLLHADMEKERQLLIESGSEYTPDPHKHYVPIDVQGLFAFSSAIIVGLLIGMIKVPLPGGGVFSLGSSGGPLLSGLLFGHFGHAGNVSLQIPKQNLQEMREFGLVLFLLGAGTAAGSGFVAILQEHGVVLFIYGALMTLVPMLTGYLIAVKIMKLNLLNSLGSICGGMTSTPALGTLINTAGTDDVASSYAATYPIALVLIVIVSQLIGVFLM